MSSFKRWNKWFDTSQKLLKKYNEQEEHLLKELRHSQGKETLLLLALLYQIIGMKIQLYQRYEHGPKIFLVRVGKAVGEHKDYRHIQHSIRFAEEYIERQLKPYAQAQYRVLAPLHQYISHIDVRYHDIENFFGHNINHKRLHKQAKKQMEIRLENYRRKLLTLPKPQIPHHLEQAVHDWKHQTRKLMHQKEVKAYVHQFRKHHHPKDIIFSEENQGLRQAIKVAACTGFVMARLLPVLGLDANTETFWMTWIMKDMADQLT